MAAHSGPTAAQDALRGKRLYLDAARMVGSGVSCVDCHGGFPPGLFGIARAANDPSAVERAVKSIPQMTPLRGRLAAADYADLAAYLGNPGVPSPALRSATSGPATTGSTERFDFGVLATGSQSATSRWHVINDGSLGVQLTAAPVLRGPHPNDFVVAASTCVAGQSLPAGGSCSLDVAFRPAGEPGSRTAALAIAHDWVGAEIAVALLGQASAPAAAPAPPPVADSGGGGAVQGIAGLGLLLAAVSRRPARRRTPPLRDSDHRLAAQ